MRSLLARLLLLVIGAGWALAMTAVLGTLLIQRPFKRLLAIADRWRSGDLAARAGLRTGSEFGRLGVAFDRVAEALEARETALRTEIENTADCVVALDREWRITYLNWRAKALVPGRNLLGQIIWEAFPGLSENDIGKACRAAAGRGVSTRVEGYYAALQTHFQALAYPSADGLTLFFRDATDERAVAAQLAEHEQVLHALGEVTPDLLYAKDRLGRTLYANPTTLAVLGCTAEKALGCTAAEFLTDPALAEAIMADDRRIMARGENEMLEEHVLDARFGGMRVWHTNKTPLRDRDTGEVVGIAGISRDVTEERRTVAALSAERARLKETESRLRDLAEDLTSRLAENEALTGQLRQEIEAREKAQARAAHAERIQALGLLAGGIAHDINNVLQAIDGAVTLIDRQPGNEADVRRLARLAIKATSRGASVTRRLLAFSRRGDLRPQALDAARLLSGLNEILVHTLGAAIDVQVRPETGVPLIFADKGQLETVLINLATNARDAMPDGGRLTLSAVTEFVSPDEPTHPAGLTPGRYVRLTVADTGIGMDAATLARVGEPFFTTKGLGAGTGLGLPMAKGFACQSGGDLRIESSPGQGTTVTLWLPEAEPGRCFAKPTPAAATDLATPVANKAASVRVLVVDDEELVLEMLGEILKAAGFNVLAAASGSQAMDLLAAGEAVDFLVTDLSMLDMDGLAVIRTARKLHPGLPAILLTGYAGNDTASAMNAAIGNNFTLLRKPIRDQDLIDQIAVLLAAGRNAQAAVY